MRMLILSWIDRTWHRLVNPQRCFRLHMTLEHDWNDVVTLSTHKNSRLRCLGREWFILIKNTDEDIQV